MRQGALWNAFIIAADAAALLGLFERRCPDIVAKMRRFIQAEPKDHCPCGTLAELYAELPDLDFSHGILRGQERYLRVLAVPECGWSDLGTPERVAAALQELKDFAPAVTSLVKSRAAVNLAAQHELLRSRVGSPAVAYGG